MGNVARLLVACSLASLCGFGGATASFFIFGDSFAGPTGETGPAGPTGPQGEPGTQGPAGKDGTGIEGLVGGYIVGESFVLDPCPPGTERFAGFSSDEVVTSVLDLGDTVSTDTLPLCRIG